MSGNYEKWLEQEKAWVDATQKKCKQDFVKYSLLILAGCVAALGALGLFASGMDIQAMLRNMLIGLAVGIVMDLFMLLMNMPTWPAKRYRKELEKKIEKALSPAEREEFASQMLESDVEKLSWIRDDKAEERMLISRDYIFSANGRGWITMIRLQKVKHIAADARDITVTTRGGGAKIQQTSAVYLLYFYYQQPVEGGKTKYDELLDFPTREMREKVSHFLNERGIEGQTL